MPKRDPSKLLLSVRIDADVARRARELCKNEAGFPHFLRLGTWVQEAIEAHLEVTEARIAGRRPTDRPPSINNRARHV